MSIDDHIINDLQHIIDQMRPHQETLTGEGAGPRPSLILRVRTKPDLETLANLLQMTDKPRLVNYQVSSMPSVWKVSDYIGSVLLTIESEVETIPRVCGYCETKHDCPHASEVAE